MKKQNSRRTKSMLGKCVKVLSHRCITSYQKHDTFTHSKIVTRCLCTAWLSKVIAFISMFNATYLKWPDLTLSFIHMREKIETFNHGIKSWYLQLHHVRLNFRYAITWFYKSMLHFYTSSQMIFDPLLSSLAHHSQNFKHFGCFCH